MSPLDSRKAILFAIGASATFGSCRNVTAELMRSSAIVSSALSINEFESIEWKRGGSIREYDVLSWFCFDSISDQQTKQHVQSLVSLEMDGQSRRKTLSQIDPNHISAIPQPSARKPSRPSQVQHQQQQQQQPLYASNPHHQRQSSYGEGRLSYAPGASQGLGVSGQRRSSAYNSGHRNSSLGGIGVLSQTNSQAPNKDPRPIRDKGFKDNAIHKIINFLQENGYPQHVVQKTLTTPTQKEFVSIFQFLYHLFDPNFQFVKKIDEDVLYCIKSIKYPFADSISRSQLTAVGSPHSWPNMLAMLVWMVDTASIVGRLLKNEIPVDDADADNPDKMYFNHFLTKAYQVFLAGADDYSEMERDLEQESDKQNEHMLMEIERLGDGNERLEKELSDLKESQPPLRSLEKEREILVSDKTKFRDYIARLDQKRARIVDSNAKLSQMLADYENEFEKLGQDKIKLQEQVDMQNISATDVEKMNSEHEALIKNLEIATAQVQEASSHVFEKERTAQSKLDSLDKAIQTYNSIGYKIGVIPVNAAHAKGLHYELDFSNPLESGKSWLGSRPDTLLNANLRGEIRPALAQLRQDLGTEVHQHQDEYIRLGELLDQVNEGLNDKKEELEALEARLGTTIEQFNEIRDTTAAESSASNAQAETLERDLAMMRNSAQNGLIHLDQRAQSVSIEYEQLVHASNALREELIRDVVKTLDEVIQFKLHIQTSLETLSAEADEVELEAGIQGAE